MKKLMIAACIIVLAGFTQAATYSWNSAGVVYTYDSVAPSWPVVQNATAYLVFADAYSQTQLVKDFASATGADFTKLSAAGNGVTTSAGKIDATDATSSYTSDQQVYFVVFQDADHMFISGEVTAAYDALYGSTVTFKAAQVDNIWNETPFDASKGYSKAGWYAAVPEPTSGLLLLLGVAGLALRRRRA